MAQTGNLDADPPAMVPNAKAAELKKELQRLVREIVEGDDFGLGTADKAIRTLTALKELKFKRSTSLKMDACDIVVPEEFKCPISKELMKDPVVLATGQTYDRPFIQRWLNEGHRTCPQTQQVLAHTVLTPNLLVHEMILQWCKENGLEPPRQAQCTDEEVVTCADRARLNVLLEKMSSSISEQKAAAKELRLLTKKMPAFRVLFGETPNAITQLLTPLLPVRPDTHPELQEDLITTVLNLSIHDNNKRLVGEDPKILSLIIESLTVGTIQTRSNAAAALFTLSALDSNKVIIGKSAAMGPLIDLLNEENTLAMKDAASAIFSLCILHENKGVAVNEGAVSVIMKKIKDGVLVDELLSILAMLSGHQRGLDEMAELGAASCLLCIMRESTSERSKENAVAIVYSICGCDRNKWREVREEEKTHGTVSKLARSGTSRAMRKAGSMLERLKRFASMTHTA